MVRPKSQPKKQQKKRGIDFKKIKRKIGRKLPPAKNATNTEIKSKAIILPEQSVVSEKAGLAVSKKGLTLKELLQQTSHHNPKVRKGALIGIRDIFIKYPEELRLHKLAVIEKLRERITDEDKLVRETLYQLFKSVIFPGCKEDNAGPFISLLMAYIFNAMTHLSIEIRLMAFKFFDLIVQYYPPSFSLYTEKVLQNYEDILQKNQFYLQDKGKLKSALAGLGRCLSLLPCHKREDDSSVKNEVDTRRVLHAFEPDAPKDPVGHSVVTKKLKDLLPILISCFQDFMPLVNSAPQLDAQSFDCILSILKSIDLVVKFLVTDKSQIELQASPPFHARPDSTLRDQTLSPALLKRLWNVFPINSTHHLSEKEDDRYFILNVIITEIFLCLSDWICPPSTLSEKFLQFIESALSDKICNNTQSRKAFHENHSISLIPFIPKLIIEVVDDWKSRLLQAFTMAFKNCNPESSLKLTCLYAIEKMLVPKQGCMYLDASDPEILDYQITWIRELPLLLILLGDKHPSSSTVVLNLQLHLGKQASVNPSFFQEYDNMQYSLTGFYSTCLDDSSIQYGPFLRLTRDIQELSVCCLYYFSFLDPILLQSLARCCLCEDLDSFILFRILEVLHSAYKAGHIQIADHISFLVTLLSHYKVLPSTFSKKSCCSMENQGKSNRETFKSIIAAVCTCLSQIGDDCLVFQMLERVVIDQISLKPHLDNMCALLRVLVTLDSRPTRLSEESIVNISNALPGYLIDVVSCIPEDDSKSSHVLRTSGAHYYLLPGLFLFHRSDKLSKLVLHEMGSWLIESSPSLSARQSTQNAPGYSSRILAVVSVLLLICTDVKLQRVLLLCKKEIERILHNICAIQSSTEINTSIDERHRVQCAHDRLKDVTRKLVNGLPLI